MKMVKTGSNVLPPMTEASKIHFMYDIKKIHHLSNIFDDKILIKKNCKYPFYLP